MSDEKEKSNLKDNVFKLAGQFGKTTKNAISTVSKNVEEGSTKLGEQLEQYNKERNLKKLCPVFEEDLNRSDFIVPSILQLVNYDKRSENKVCKGSIGFETRVNDIRVLTIYYEFSNLLNVRFYPQKVAGTYYVDPCFPDLYIDVAEYFAYMKKVRVDELEAVAQILGAKQFKIELKVLQKNTSSTGNAGKASYKLLKANASSQLSKNEFACISVAAESSFEGNQNPIKPELIYFKDDTNINALVDMRTDINRRNSLISKTYSIQYGNTSGVKLEQAADISSALKTVNCGFATAFSQIAQEENQTILEYSITF